MEQTRTIDGRVTAVRGAVLDVAFDGEEGLRHLGWLGLGLFAVLSHPPFALAVQAVRIDDQDLTGVVAKGSPALPQGVVSSPRTTSVYGL